MEKEKRSQNILTIKGGKLTTVKVKGTCMVEWAKNYTKSANKPINQKTKLMEKEYTEKQMDSAYDIGFKHGQEKSTVLRDNGKHIKMFAGWLLDEGYLMDAEKTTPLDIEELYNTWTGYN